MSAESLEGMNSLELILICFKPSAWPNDDAGLWNSADPMFKDDPTAGVSTVLVLYIAPTGCWFFTFCCLLIFVLLTWS